MNTDALRESLKKIDPRLWLIIGLGVIIVGFCLFKAIQATSLHRSPTDRPAPAFDPVPPTLLTSQNGQIDPSLQTPRLPTDIYLSLSDRAYAVARRALLGRVSVYGFRQQGMDRATASRAAHYFASIAGTIRGLRVIYGPYTLTSLTSSSATFTASVTLSDRQGGAPPKQGTTAVIFNSADRFRHSAISSISFQIS